MKRAMIDIRIMVMCLVALLNVTTFAGAEQRIGEDGLPILPGEEITDGIGIIDKISFSEGWVIIDDMRFTITDNTELINKRQNNADPRIFIAGTRVVWAAKGGQTLIKMDHYPFDQTEETVKPVADRQEGDPVPTTSPPTDISLGSDGVYRN